MATAEDNFRIEVWDRDGVALLETISRSPDYVVSKSAWHEAIRRRPGRLLIHYNASHVMERLISPGEPTIEPSVIVEGSKHAGIDATLKDLRGWHRLQAWCVSCRHHAVMDAGKLKDRFGEDVYFSTIEKKLKCSACMKGHVRLEVHNAPRG